MEWFRIEQAEGPLDLHVLMPGAVYTPLIAKGLPDPAQAPPELGLITPSALCRDRFKRHGPGLVLYPNPRPYF